MDGRVRDGAGPFSKNRLHRQSEREQIQVDADGPAHSLKSIALTAQLEYPLGKALPAPTLAFAGRYSYLPNDTVAATGVIAPATSSATIANTPKGHIGLR